MKRSQVLTTAGLVLGLGIPLTFALAQQTFTGPPNCSTPPCNNVPGVIWNAQTGSVQPNAQMDFSGTNWGTYPTVKSDFGLNTGNFFRIDQSGPSTFGMKNKGGLGGTSKPFTFSIEGGLKTIGISGNSVLGEDGRMQADKFCFNPGNPADCITSWPSGGGNYVLKTGDTMSGALSITDPNAGSNGIYAKGVANGGFFEDTAGDQGFIGSSAGYGGYFIGNTGGAYAKSTVAQLLSSQYVMGINTLGEANGTAQYLSGGNLVATLGVGGRATSWAHGLNVSAQSNSTGNGATPELTGTDSSAYNLTDGAIPYITGVRGYAQGKGTTELKGVYGQAFVNKPSGNTALGVDGLVQVDAASIPTAIGLRGRVTQTGAGIPTAAYGVYGSTNGSSASGGAGVYGEADGNGSYGGSFQSANGNGIRSVGKSIGGEFHATDYGISTDAATAGILSNGNWGGLFTGTINDGISTWGTRYGITSQGIQGGAVFANNAPAPNNNVVYLSRNNTDAIFAENGDVTVQNGRLSVGTTAHRGAIEAKSTTNNTSQWSSSNLGASLVVSGDRNPAIALTAATGYPAVKPWAVWNNSSNQLTFSVMPTLGSAPVAGDIQNIYTFPTNGAASKQGGTTAWVVTSDGRLKDIHGEFTRGLADLMNIQPVSFNYKKDNPLGISSNESYIGVIAQNVQQTIPEAVSTGANGYLQLNTDPILWTMVNSIKELKTQNDSLKAQVDDLTARVNALEAKLEQ